MMRKDVKVGFVIGGILVAVLVAVALVGGPKKKPAGGAELATGENTSGDQSANPQDKPPSQSDTSAAKSAEGPAPVPPGGEKTGTDVFGPSGGQTAVAQGNSTDAKKDDPTDRWMSLLNNGVAPMMTTTPGPAGSARNPAPDKSPVTKSPGEILRVAPADGASVAKESASPATQPTASSRTHVVQPNETFSTISAAAYGSANFYPYIQRANPGVDPRKLRPGMTLVLPPVSEVKGISGAPVETNSPASLNRTPDVDSKTQYVVEPNDSLHRIAVKLYGDSAKWQAIYDLNKTQIGPDPAKLKLHSVLKLPEPPTVH